MTVSRALPIVLAAGRTLMSEYGGGIFLGFSAYVPKGLITDKLYFSIFGPPINVNEDGSVDVAPCGTRKVEATLLDYGFRREDVVVAACIFLHYFQVGLNHESASHIPSASY